MDLKNRNPVNPKRPKRIAIVLANPAKNTNAGWQCGFWWSELAHPYYVLSQKGYEIAVLRARTDDRSEVQAIPVGWKMIIISLASNPTEARKFFRDDEARSDTPGLDAVRVGMPSLSRAWGSISIVVVSRNADVARDHHLSSGSKWRYDAVLPGSTSYASGKLSGVTTNAITTCGQSGRLSRL
jgi:hypothetical protein